MTDGKTDIPDKLREPAEAAVRWINETQGREFELTGVVDFERALAASMSEPVELGLVLCDGELCLREQVGITPVATGYSFELLPATTRMVPPLLDPPAGMRTDWLAGELANHSFVLLLFYRGLW